MQLELENARDKWKQQCDEEVARRLAGKEEELVKKMEDKEEELARKVKEAEEKVKSLWAADLAKLRQNFQVKKKHLNVLQTLVPQVKMDKAKNDWMEMVGEKESSTEGAAAVNVIQ